MNNFKLNKDLLMLKSRLKFNEVEIFCLFILYFNK